MRGLGKRYGSRSVLRGVDLEVRPGEAVALWGGNGAGKTTALRSILGIVSHEGEMLLHRNMKAAPEPFLKAVAPYRDPAARPRDG